MQLTLVEDQAIAARMALIVGADNFDRLFRGVQFDEFDGTVLYVYAADEGAVAGLVGIRVGVVSGVINLESSGVEASDWRPRHAEPYHEA